jgi:hypothetical protein
VQGFKPHTFDIVVAANVLHATRDLPETLAHVRSLLAPGGLLLLFEVTEHLGWFDITTGLIEGWGRFEDDLRQDNPLLSATQWHEALISGGFEQVMALPEAGSPAEALGQHILMAQAPSAQIGVEGDASAAAFELVDGSWPQAPGDEASTTGATEDLVRRLTAALPDERRELLIDYVRVHVARILRLPALPRLGRQERLLDLGLDSLMAVELRNRLGTGLGLNRPLSATLVFDYPTIDAIAGYLARGLFESDEEPGAVSEAQPQTGLPPGQNEGVAPTDIARLSDEEVETLLLKKLENL